MQEFSSRFKFTKSFDVNYWWSLFFVVNCSPGGAAKLHFVEKNKNENSIAFKKQAAFCIKNVMLNHKNCHII